MKRFCVSTSRSDGLISLTAPEPAGDPERVLPGVTRKSLLDELGLWDNRTNNGLKPVLGDMTTTQDETGSCSARAHLVGPASPENTNQVTTRLKLLCFQSNAFIRESTEFDGREPEVPVITPVVLLTTVNKCKSSRWKLVAVYRRRCSGLRLNFHCNH